MAGMRQEIAIDGFRLAYERTGFRACGAAAAWLAGGPDRLPRGRPARGAGRRRDRARPAGVRRVRQAPGRSGQPVQRHRPGPQRHRADRRAGAGTGGHRRLRHWQQDRPGHRPGPARPGPRPGHRAPAARDRGPDPRPAGPAGVLVPGLPQHRARHPAGRRPTGRRPRVPAAFLVALVRARLRAGPDHLDHLVSVYGPPGAFAASIAWPRRSSRCTRASAPARDPPDRGPRSWRPTSCARCWCQR